VLQVEEEARRGRAGAGGRRRAWRPRAKLGQRLGGVARAGENSEEELGRRLAGERRVGLPEAGGGIGRAAATVSGGGGAARAGGRTAWRGEERPPQVGRAAGGVLEQHVARRGVARGQLRLGTWPARATGRRREKQREEGAGGRR
jgi:hypothetical protein